VYPRVGLDALEKRDNSHAYIRIRTPEPPAPSISCFRVTDSMGLGITRNYFFSFTQLIPVVFWIIRITDGVKVKLSRYWPGVAQRVGRGIALLFHERSIRRG
jgi:hypothetical protein